MSLSSLHCSLSFFICYNFYSKTSDGQKKRISKGSLDSLENSAMGIKPPDILDMGC